jgi:hypothetical protein
VVQRGVWLIGLTSYVWLPAQTVYVGHSATKTARVVSPIFLVAIEHIASQWNSIGRRGAYVFDSWPLCAAYISYHHRPLVDEQSYVAC